MLFDSILCIGPVSIVKSCQSDIFVLQNRNIISAEADLNSPLRLWVLG